MNTASLYYDERMVTNLRVLRVHALEHTALLHEAASGQPRRRPGWSWSFVVHIHATDAQGLQYLGVGESDAESKLEKTEQKEAWQALSRAAQSLVGMELTDADSIVDIADRLVPAEADATVATAIKEALKDLLVDGDGVVWSRYREVLPHVRRHMWAPGAKKILDPEGRQGNLYDLDIYRGLKRVGEANQALETAALMRGLGTLRTSWKDFTATDESGNRMTFGLSYSEASSPVSGAITNNKQLTREFLQRANVPVPDGRAFTHIEIEDAERYADDLGYPVVVKPLAGKSGRGVVAGIQAADELRWAIDQALRIEGQKSRFIVEKHVPGHDYRVYVAYGEVMSVVRRTPASVTGDGVRTIAELVLAKNHQRQQNPHTRSRPLQLDEAADFLLSQQGKAWSSIPEAGETVALAAAANISRGGDSTEVLPETHPSILDAAVKAVDAIPGLNQAGVDFLLPDHTLALEEQDAGICEINTTPALMASQAPVFGEVQPIVQKLIEHAARDAGVALAAPREQLTLEVRARDVHAPKDLQDWFVGHARRLKLRGRVAAVGKSAIRMHVSGPAAPVSALIAALHTTPGTIRPESVVTAPLDATLPQQFEEAQ